MLMPCETIMKEFLPAIRAGITKELSNKYSYNQTEIASKLGITQAAVSKYLTGDYTEPIKHLENSKELRDVIENIASNIANGSFKKKEIIETVCTKCEQFFDDEWNCTIGKMVLARK